MDVCGGRGGVTAALAPWQLQQLALVHGSGVVRGLLPLLRQALVNDCSCCPPPRRHAVVALLISVCCGSPAAPKDL